MPFSAQALREAGVMAESRVGIKLSLQVKSGRKTAPLWSAGSVYFTGAMTMVI